MTIYELVDIALKISNRIDLQWGLFISVHAAFLGAIVYIDRPLSRLEKLVALIMYFGFAAINYNQMDVQIQLLGAVYQDIVLAIQQGGSDVLNIAQRFSVEADMGRETISRRVVVAAHLLMSIIVLLSVIFDSKLPKRKE
ncbi:MAG: hypothetical protein AAF431_07430 [Pseudomonadota bacterium]